MHLNSDEWVVGKDYSAAPTCATCHMTATTNMSATHNINERLDWSKLLQETNALAVKEKCGLPDVVQMKPYEQPIPDIEHKNNMKNVCSACHSKIFVDNFLVQYENEVQLYMEKWITPGKELFELATRVLQADEKDKYQFFTHPVDFAWWGMCNSDAKNAHTGAAMMSPAMLETGNSGFAAGWYTGFMPAIEGITKEYEKDCRCDVKEAVKNLKAYYYRIRSNQVYYGPWKDKKRNNEQ